MLQSAISLRNRLAHGYDQDIDNHVIWRTVTVSIPRLIEEADGILQAGDDSEPDALCGYG